MLPGIVVDIATPLNSFPLPKCMLSISFLLLRVVVMMKKICGWPVLGATVTRDRRLWPLIRILVMIRYFSAQENSIGPGIFVGLMMELRLWGLRQLAGPQWRRFV